MHRTVFKKINNFGRALVRPFCDLYRSDRRGSILILRAAPLLIALTALCLGEAALAAESGGAAGSGGAAATRDTGRESVWIEVSGRYELPDIDAALDRINEIRLEACREGVPDPSTGDPLTPDDYVPMQWSPLLEECAAQRAAEGTVYHSHTRPNGEAFYTVVENAGNAEEFPYAAEVLAWGFDGISGAIEGWYSEKDSYLGSDTGQAGHYMALINPANQYAGFAALSGCGGRDVCAGFMADRPGGGHKGPVVYGQEVTRTVEVLQSLLPDAVKEAVDEASLRILLAGDVRQYFD